MGQLRHPIFVNPGVIPPWFNHLQGHSLEAGCRKVAGFVLSCERKTPDAGCVADIRPGRSENPHDLLLGTLTERGHLFLLDAFPQRETCGVEIA